MSWPFKGKMPKWAESISLRIACYDKRFKVQMPEAIRQAKTQIMFDVRQTFGLQRCYIDMTGSPLCDIKVNSELAICDEKIFNLKLELQRLYDYLGIVNKHIDSRDVFVKREDIKQENK